MHIPLASVRSLREPYANVAKIVADNSLNVENAIAIDTQAYQNIIDSVRSVGTIDPRTVSSNKVTLFVDPYINYYIFDNKNAQSFKDGIFVCLTRKKPTKDDCIWNLEGKVVAYLFTSDFLFVQAIIKAYRLDEQKINMKRIELKDLNVFNNTFDYCITYAVIGSEYMNYLENVVYYKNGFKDVDINRIRPFYPFIKENYNTMVYYFSDEQKRSYVNTENNVLIPIMNYSIVAYATVEGFITRLDTEGQNNVIDIDRTRLYEVGYGCYGNVNIVNNKYECNSLYNVDGTPKTYYSLWDKRCKVNTDCPYYQSNKNYPNERGGCLDGFCEFPVGIKRLGFTKYDDKDLNNPLCYECSDMNDLECCKRIQRGTGKTPDYVFSDDFQDRVKNNMNTIISLLEYRMHK